MIQGSSRAAVEAARQFEREAATIWPRALSDGVVSEPVAAVVARVLVGRLDGTSRRVSQEGIGDTETWAAGLVLFWLSITQRYQDSLIASLAGVLARILGEGGTEKEVRDAVLSEADNWGRSGARGTRAESLLGSAWSQHYQEAYGDFHADDTSALVWPYLEYRHIGAQGIGDGRVRDNHLALGGFVASATWPNWRVIEPPNGYGCRCRLVPRSYSEADSLGWSGDFPLGTEPLEDFLRLGGADEGFPKAQFFT